VTPAIGRRRKAATMAGPSGSLPCIPPIIRIFIAILIQKP